MPRMERPGLAAATASYAYGYYARQAGTQFYVHGSDDPKMVPYGPYATMDQAKARIESLKQGKVRV